MQKIRWIRLGLAVSGACGAALLWSWAVQPAGGLLPSQRLFSFHGQPVTVASTRPLSREVVQRAVLAAQEDPHMERYPLTQSSAGDARTLVLGLYDVGVGSPIVHVVSDEGTHSLYALANSEGHQKIRELVASMEQPVP